jgi:hypothetical protein
MIEKFWRLGGRFTHAVMIAAAVSVVVTSPTVAKQRARQAASPSPRQVVSCLKKAHLVSVFRSASDLWDGWDSKVGGFVYAQAYPTGKSALSEARFLSDEETGISGRLVISQHIAPYKGSPVPTIVKCLGGKMVSKTPSSGGGVYKF